MKKVISAIMSIAILVIPCSVSAMPDSNVNQSNTVVDSYQDFIRKKICLDNSIEKVIESGDINRVKQNINNVDNVVDKNYKKVDFFKSIGINVLPSTKLNSVLMDEFENIESVHTSIQYQIIDNAGDINVVSEAECLKEVEKVKIEQQLKNVSRASVPTISPNGYMRQTLTSIYIGNASQKGYYILVGQNEWLITPLIRYIDVYSLCSNDFSFIRDPNGYENVLSYTKRYQNNYADFADTSNNMPEIYDNGCYYSNRLPSDYGTGIYFTSFSNIMTQITAKARIKDYNNPNRQIDVTQKYVHNQTGISVTPSWELGKNPGVGLSLVANPKTYYNSLSFDYADDYK